MAELEDPRLPEDPLSAYILIYWGEDGDLEIDQGAINHYETVGILQAVLRELEDRNPPVRVRWDGMTSVATFDEEDDEDS